MKTLRIIGALVAPLAIAAVAAPVALAAPAPRVALETDAVSGLDQAQHVGAVPADQRVSVAVSLNLRNGTELDRTIAAVNDPHSAQYGHFLTPEQFTARFGPTDDQVNRVKEYLRGQGLSVDAVSGNHLTVDASGPAEKVARAFGTTLANYRDGRTNRPFYANTSAPTLPADLAGVVLDVAGLNNRQIRVHHAAVNPHAGPGGGFTPTQLKGAYDVTSTGYNGSGQTVALWEFDGFQQTNITKYDSYYGTGSPTPKVQQVSGGSGPIGDGQVEVELDIEAIQAIAPKAAITVFEAPNTDQGEVDLANAIVASRISVTSISWGLSEKGRTTSGIQAVDNVLKQGAAQGQSFFAASGDDGSDDNGDGSTSVDFPASDPYVTGVGGTNLSTSTTTSWKSETAWNGSGGGTSTVFALPSFQSGVKVGTTNKRQVPDVSAQGGPTGISVYTQGQWTSVYGTSGAAPIWAGVAAIYNQAAAAAGRTGLGSANAKLYALAKTNFHDITSGSNGAYKAGSGFDLVTGIGTPDTAKILAAGIK
ncbi:S53 family peptidase [Kutzneria kofuensis]|uniref:Kumamolisin n=1 Tax=Kutzneria kofuensis TaxID=103725 RepID=A0A7W9KDD9_9PSEU|nr:S53 family serine peptidase [Kutzneria kofuensis]MBB5890552.1 kumamolisin [Kutzneria kofuensis]